jgi:hypothetical protein
VVPDAEGEPGHSRDEEHGQHRYPKEQDRHAVGVSAVGQELAAILSKTEEAAADGEFELFKTSAHFDSTAQHPQWLGSETQLVKQLGGDT